MLSLPPIFIDIRQYHTVTTRYQAVTKFVDADCLFSITLAPFSYADDIFATLTPPWLPYADELPALI